MRPREENATPMATKPDPPAAPLDQLITDWEPKLDQLIANSSDILDGLSAALSGDFDEMLKPLREENVTPMVTKTAQI